MLGELGYFALILATCGMALNAVYTLRFGSTELLTTTSIYTHACVAMTVSILVLWWALLSGDYSIKYVWANSHQALPWVYKLTSLWSGHEGSWLLWTGISFYYGRALLGQLHALDVESKWLNTGTLSMFLACYGLYALLASNPFVRIYPIAPGNGMDINPLLQDPGLMIHPPSLYMGNCGLLVVFFLVLNVLRTDDVEIVGLYYRVILSWALWSWGWLTVGITLGSWWAYRELGWGGYWFWDPVENAALMPWLCVTALIHALRIEEGQGKRDWVCIAGGSAFVLAIFGGFITRSGVLVSVHGFARDRLHGLLLMAMVVYACILVCVHWGRRQNDCVEKKECNNKSISLISQNKILLSMGFIVWFGTVYPILIAWFTDDMMTVGAGYFQQVLEPIFLLLLWALARSLGKIGAVRQFIIYAFSLGVSFVINTVMGGGMVVVDMWAVVIVAVLVSLIMRLLLHHLEHQALLNRSLVGHMAFLLLFLCIYINHAYTTESMGLLEKGKPGQFGHFQVHLLEVKRQQTERVDEETLFIQVDDGKQKYPLEPVIKRFKKRDIWKSKAAIRHSVWGDSMAIVVKESQNQYAIRIHQKPLQSIFWLCGLVMGFLGIASGYELQRVRRGSE